MKTRYTYYGTDGNGGFHSGTTRGEHGSMQEALQEINKTVHSCLKCEAESGVSTCYLPSEFDGKFYGVGSMGKIFIRTKCGDTNVLDVRAWGYLTGRGGGLAMSNDSACEAQDKFEAWVIEALNAYRDNSKQSHGESK